MARHAVLERSCSVRAIAVVDLRGPACGMGQNLAASPSLFASCIQELQDCRRTAEMGLRFRV